ncbi:TolC family protein [Terriglobus saanensis]|uniref:Outer membrane efflux protein n=1 Tax=Terriglobus saanensis (strain ATCC BAA-1853 / DSM 23119 / SP1PR4) TaxID=401053 RepID=E8V8Q4_TERSS|nr:TolC family protein [Terriglobus saanensis]ADV84091.1 outer membrane efflux protein [Terriglobus saanensis SP1PR4]
MTRFRLNQLLVVATVLSLGAVAVAEDADVLPQGPQPQNVVSAPAPLVASLSIPSKIEGVEIAHSTGAALPLSLDQAIDLALKRSLSVALNQQNERQIGGLQLTVLNALIPSLSFSAQTSTQEVNLAAMGFKPATVAAFLPAGTTFDTIVKYDTTSAQVNLAQQLFNLPAYEAYKASKETARAIVFNSLLNRGDVVQGVATQYLMVLSDVDAIRNAQSQLISDTELVRQSAARHDAGVGTNLDLLRARVEMQQRERDLIVAQNNFAKDKIQLNRLMGIAADQELELTDPMPYNALEQLPLEDAKRLAYTRRKDLLSLQAQLQSSVLQRKAIRYERLPVVSVNGYYGVIGQTTGLYHGNFTAQGGLNFPIFEEARIRGDAEIAEADLRKLRAQIGSLRIDIEQQIRSSKLDVDSSAELVQVTRSNVALAIEALDQSSQRYRAGVDDTLPVVQAQATLADAQQRQTAAVFRFNQAKINLARATGVVETQYQNYLGK